MSIVVSDPTIPDEQFSRLLELNIHGNGNWSSRTRVTRTPYHTLVQETVGVAFMQKGENNAVVYKPITKERYVEKYNRLGPYFYKVPLKAIEAYCNNPDLYRLKVTPRWGYRSLVYLDFDAFENDPQSLDDCKALMAYAHTVLPGMPHEDIVNERGVGNWIVADSSQMQPDEYNALVVRLEEHFESVARKMGLRVKCVEVRGQVPEHNIVNRVLVSVKMGQLIKCPPDEAYFLQRPVPAERFLDQRFDAVQFLVEEGVNDVGPSSLRSEGGPGAAKPAPAHSAKRACGSFTPKRQAPLNTDRIPALIDFLITQFPDRPTRCGADDRAITDRRFAELVFTLYHCVPNADGTNPSKAHKQFVQDRQQEGSFDYRWDAQVYKAVRDFLSSIGGLDWVDEVYHPPGKKGESGVPMKWGLDQAFKEQVKLVIEGDKDTSLSPSSMLIYRERKYGGENRRPRCALFVCDLPVGYEAALAAIFDPNWQQAA